MKACSRTSSHCIVVSQEYSIKKCKVFSNNQSQTDSVLVSEELSIYKIFWEKLKLKVKNCKVKKKVLCFPFIFLSLSFVFAVCFGTT